MQRFDPVKTHSANKLEGAQKSPKDFVSIDIVPPDQDTETHVDRSEDDLGDKRVLDPDRLEDGSSVVEEVLRAHVHPYIVSNNRTSLQTGKRPRDSRSPRSTAGTPS